MPREEADIQGGMLNQFQRLIDIALETRDIEYQQRDILDFIAGNNMSKDPAESQAPVRAVPTPQTQVQAINQTVDVSPVVNELRAQTDLLAQIASSLNKGDVQTMNPGEDAMEKVSMDKESGESAKRAIGLIIMLGGAFLVLAMGLDMMKKIDMQNFIMISAGLSMMFATITQIGSGGVGIVDILLLDALIKTYARALVDMSIILQDMQAVSEEKMLTLFALSATVIPLYGILAFMESKLSTASTVSLMIFGFTLPSIASVLVKTAGIVATFPSDFKMSAVTAMVGMSAALFPLVLSAGRLFQATAGVAAATGLDSILNRLTFVGGELSIGKAAIGPNFYLATLFRVGATLAMIPLLAMSMLGIAWMFSEYAKAGGTFVAPPTKWSISIGIAMFFFSSAVSKIIYSLDPTMISSVQKWNKDSGIKTVDRQNITKSNIPGALAVVGALAIAMVTTGYIMSLFPKSAESSTPDQKWVMNVGFGLVLFSMALKRIVKAMRGDDSSFNLNRSSEGDGASRSLGLNLNLGMATSMLFMASIAFSMVLVARILMMFPKNPIVPPISWTLSVGLSMLVFAKAYHAIATVTTSSGGLIGAIKGVKKEKDTSVGRAMGGLLYMNLMALSMVSVALIFELMPKNPMSPPIGWTLSTGLALLLFSKAAAMLFSMKNKVSVKGEGNTINLGGGGGAMGKALGGFTFIIGLASAIVATAWIFQLLPSTYKVPDLGWILKSGLALVAFTMPLYMMVKAKGSKKLQEEGKKGKSSGSLLQIILTATAIVVVSWLFQALPSESSFKAPPLSWVLSAGVALTLFGMGMVKMHNAFEGKFNLKTVGEMALLAGFVATAVIAVAWMFQLLPSNFKSPDLLWTVQVGLSMALFAAVLVATKKFDLTQDDVNRGALTLLKISASVVAMAWIFQLLPANQETPDILLLGMISIMLITVGGSLALLGVMNKKGAIDRGTRTLDNILIASLAVSAIMLVVGNSKATFGDIGVFVAFLGVMVLMSVGLALLGKRSDLIIRGADVLRSLAKPIAFLAIGMAIWSAAGIRIGDVLLLGFTVGVIATIGVLMGGRDTSKRIRRGLYVMTLMSIPLMSLGLALLAWKLINPNPKKTMISLLLLTAIVGVFALIGFVLGHPKAYKRIATGLLVMTLAAIPIMALAYAFAMWNETFPSVDEAKERLILFGIATAALAAGFAILGAPAVAQAVAIGAAVVMGIGAAIFVVGKGMKSISEAAKVAMESGAFEDSGQKNMLGMRMTHFEVIMRGIARGFALDPITAAFMAIGIPAYLGASVALYTIGKALKSFEELDVNAVHLAGTLIPQVLTAVTDAFEHVGKKNAVGFIKGIFVKGPVAAGIDAIKGAGAVLAEITTGLVAFSNMKFTDANGNEVMLSPAKLMRVTDNIVMVLDSLSNAFKIVGERNKKDYGFGGLLNSLMDFNPLTMFKRGPVAEGIHSVKGMGAVLTEIAAGLVAFADMKFTDADGNTIVLDGAKLMTVSQNIVKVLTTVSDAFAQVGMMNKKDYSFAGGNIFGMAITEMFTDGPIADGVNATEGMGLILSQVAEGLVAFADMKFTDAEGNVIQITDDVLAKVTQNVAQVMTALGKVFADIGEGYNAGGFMGFFGANQVQRGVEAVQGVGTELVNIVSAVKDIASFTFSDGEGNTVTLTEDMLRYIPDLDPTDPAQGSVIRNIAMVVGAVAAVFADIGKNYEEDTFWFPGNYVQIGIEAVKGVGTELVNIVTAVKGIAEMIDIDVPKLKTLTYNIMKMLPVGVIMAGKLIEEAGGKEKLTETVIFLKGIPEVLTQSVEALKLTDQITPDKVLMYEQTVPRIISLIPNAVMSSIQKMGEVVGDPAAAFKLVNDSSKIISEAIEKIAKHEEPLQKVANSFEIIATSMLDMKDAIDTLDVLKLEKNEYNVF
jgi:hypothetical protein